MDARISGLEGFGPRRLRAGSPGVRCSSENTTNDTASSTEILAITIKRSDL
jgi:hypothetical protein